MAQGTALIAGASPGIDLAKEAGGKGIRVQAALPGATRTEIRAPTASELARRDVAPRYRAAAETGAA